MREGGGGGGGVILYLHENKISSEVKTTEQLLCGRIYTSSILCEYCNLKYELLVHAWREPGNKGDKRAHVLITA